MSNEELEQDDDLEGLADEDSDVDDVVSDVDDDDSTGDDEPEAPVRARKGKAKALDDEPVPSLEAKQKERDELARAMEEFLARGGKVQKIDDNVMADPPKKPDNKYGSRPI